MQSALDLGIPISGIAEAMFARALSSKRSSARPRPNCSVREAVDGEPDTFVEDVRRALYASKVVAYSQGFDQIVAGREVQLGYRQGDIAKIWRGGCIIRARFLNRITEAYEENPELPSLLAAPYFAAAVRDARTPGVGSSRRRRSRASRPRRSPRRSPITTASALTGCRRR